MSRDGKGAGVREKGDRKFSQLSGELTKKERNGDWVTPRNMHEGGILNKNRKKVSGAGPESEGGTAQSKPGERKIWGSTELMRLKKKGRELSSRNAHCRSQPEGGP